LVEDNPGDARLYQELLADSRDAAFEVVRADRLSAAIQRLSEETFDVILLDLGLPDSHGTDTITALEKVCAGVPIVVLTGLGDEAVGRQALYKGAQDYLVKGQADTELLSRSIRYAVERKRGQTERRALEERLVQAEKMEAIGKLAGGIAHDFNNLRGAIAGYADMLLQMEGDARVHKYSSMILQASERGASLVSKLLAFARRARIKRVPVDCHRVVTQVADMLGETLTREVELRTDLQAVRFTILGDENQFVNMLINLAVNARDAMPGGGTLVIATRNEVIDAEASRHAEDMEPGEYFVLTARDTGCGMDAETMKRVFEPFFTTKGAGKGTGLGLASVYGSVKQHGGHVEVSSQVGGGTEFRVYLPVAQLEEEAPREEPHPGIVTCQGTVLVVDDDPMMLEAAAEMLNAMGYTVVARKDGVEAVEHYRDHHREIDLVVLDVVMPRMDGVECLRRIRGINPAAVVVAISGYSDREKEQSIVREGAKALLKKPFRASQLSSVLAFSRRQTV
jgi:signal transduction histidine kinase